MKFMFIVAVVALTALVVTANARGATAQRMHVTGEIIDSWCYISGIMGEGEAITGTAHHQCALWCAAGGIPVAVLSDDGVIYMILKVGDDDVSNANQRIMEIQSNRVTVEGDVIIRDGIQYIIIDDIFENAGIVNRTHEDYGVIPDFGVPEQ